MTEHLHYHVSFHFIILFIKGIQIFPVYSLVCLWVDDQHMLLLLESRTRTLDLNQKVAWISMFWIRTEPKPYSEGLKLQVRFFVVNDSTSIFWTFVTAGLQPAQVLLLYHSATLRCSTGTSRTSSSWWYPRWILIKLCLSSESWLLLWILLCP